jgi:hypothetical protein
MPLRPPPYLEIACDRGPTLSGELAYKPNFAEAPLPPQSLRTSVSRHPIGYHRAVLIDVDVNVNQAGVR